MQVNLYSFLKRIVSLSFIISLLSTHLFAGNGNFKWPITTITTSPVTGSIFACAGNASTSPNIQQFTVSGSGLTAVIIAKAPPGFQVSLSTNSGYGDNVSIPQSNGNTTATIIYIRSSATAAPGSISGNVVLSTTGAADKKLVVTGRINALPTVNSLPNVLITAGSATNTINFTGTANTFKWVNNMPGIGLPTNGTGNISSFNAINTGASPATATITVTPFYSASFAYIANYTSNTVSVINTATNSVTATIPVGSGPDGVAVSPDGSRLYIVNNGSETVSVINTSNNTVITTITVDMIPVDACVSPDGKRIYVTNNIAGTVAVIDAAANTVIKLVKAGKGLKGIAITPDGNSLYVVCSTDNSISVINTTTYAITATIRADFGPNLVAISPDGSKVYQLNQRSDNLGVISTTTNRFIASITTGRNPGGLSISADGGTVYVSNFGLNTVSAINTQTNTITATIPVGQGPSSYGNFISNSIGCTGVPVTFTITVNPKPAATPAIVSTGVLPAFETTQGIPSSTGNFVVYGTDLRAGILITSPPGFELSADNLTFTNKITLGSTGNSLPVKVFVRLAGATAPGSYPANILLSSPGAVSVNVPITSAVVLPAIAPILKADQLSGRITLCAGTASENPNVQQLKISGSNLTANIIATAPAGFEVSYNPSTGYSNSVTLIKSQSSVIPTTLYIRAASLATVGTISGNLVLSSIGAQSLKVLVTAKINALPVVNPVANQTVNNSQPTTPINFTGSAQTFAWVNNTPGIGLAANGTGNISSFTAINTGNSPVTATIVTTPVPSGFVYIAESGPNDVLVYRPSTNSIIATIKVGNGPYGVWLSPDGSRLYVTNEFDYNVSVINTTTNQVITNIPVGNNPRGICVSNDGRTVYVTNFASNTLSVIDAETNKVTATIHVGSHPECVKISPDGSRLYVANNSAASISVFDTANNALLYDITGINSPLGLSFSPDGNVLYVANSFSKTVTVVNTATRAIKAIIPVGDHPNSIALSPDGSRAYVTNTFSATLSIINTDNNAVITTVGVGLGATGVSVSPDGGQVYVANSSAYSVSVINTASNSLASTITLNTFSSPSSFGNFVSAGTGCSGKPVTFTITVNPRLPGTPKITVTGILPVLHTIYGIASAPASFKVSGSNLTNGILVTVPRGTEVSQDNVNFTSSLIIDKAGNSTSATVFIRLASTSPAGAYSGNVVLSSAGAIDVNIPLASSTIDKALLTVAANSQSKIYGQDNPLFTLNYSGFKNGDSDVNLSTKPSATTTANANSAIGNYAIIPAGAIAANYNFNYLNGVLKIIPATIPIAFNGLAVKTYGDADFNLTATSANGDPIIYNCNNPAIATVTIGGEVHITGAGSAIITAAIAANVNYIANPISQTLIVNKANQFINIPDVPTLSIGSGYDLGIITANSGLPLTFTTSDRAIATINGQILNVLGAGTITLIISQNGNANYNPVGKTLQITVTGFDDKQLIVHKELSPNGDGINDFLLIEGIENFPDNSLTVVNRNGVKVFCIEGYNNAAKAFTGRSNITGTLQQAGTYYYIIEYAVNNSQKRKTGYFVLKYQ